MSPSRLGYIWEPFSPRHRPGHATDQVRALLPVHLRGELRGLRGSAGRHDRLPLPAAGRVPLAAQAPGRRANAARLGRYSRTSAGVERPPCSRIRSRSSPRSGWPTVSTSTSSSLIRHPAAFVASLKTRNWRHSFQSFLDQPLLMRDFLASLRGGDPLPRRRKARHRRRVGRALEAALLGRRALPGDAAGLDLRPPRGSLPQHPARLPQALRQLDLEWGEEVEKFIARPRARATSPSTATPARSGETAPPTPGAGRSSSARGSGARPQDHRSALEALVRDADWGESERQSTDLRGRCVILVRAPRRAPVGAERWGRSSAGSRGRLRRVPRLLTPVRAYRVEAHQTVSKPERN